MKSADEVNQNDETTREKSRNVTETVQKIEFADSDKGHPDPQDNSHKIESTAGVILSKADKLSVKEDKSNQTIEGTKGKSLDLSNGEDSAVDLPKQYGKLGKETDNTKSNKVENTISNKGVTGRHFQRAWGRGQQEWGAASSFKYQAKTGSEHLPYTYRAQSSYDNCQSKRGYFGGQGRGTRTFCDEKKDEGSRKMSPLPPGTEEKRGNIHFFFRSNNPLSQHYKCKFVVEEQKFNSAEQFMMYHKAVLFKDEEIAKEILTGDDPKVHKELGRQVKGFDDEVWNTKAEDIVLTANVAKFSQNESLTKILLGTGDKILAEASPYDRKWGIGMSESHKDAFNSKRWKGQNKLGKILMEVRRLIKG